jgi:hypothetical protein
LVNGFSGWNGWWLVWRIVLYSGCQAAGGGGFACAMNAFNRGALSSHQVAGGTRSHKSLIAQGWEVSPSSRLTSLAVPRFSFE